MKFKPAILLIILIFFTNVCGQHNQQTPAETVRDFWNLVLENKLDEAMNDFTAKSLTDEKIIRVELEMIKINQPKIVSIASNEDINGIIAEMNVETKDKDGKKVTYSVQFLKEKYTQKWKIIFLFKRFVPAQIRNRLLVPQKIITPTNFPTNYRTNCVKCV